MIIQKWYYDNLKTLKISYNFKQLCRLLDEIQYCFHFLHPFAPKTVSLIVKDIGYKKSKLKHVFSGKYK